jgi:hypothetical protein
VVELAKQYLDQPRGNAESVLGEISEDLRAWLKRRNVEFPAGGRLDWYRAARVSLVESVVGLYVREHPHYAEREQMSPKEMRPINHPTD